MWRIGTIAAYAPFPAKSVYLRASALAGPRRHARIISAEATAVLIKFCRLPL